MSSEALYKAREALKLQIKGFDNSYQVGKKATLASILHKIEDNTSISDNEVNHLYNIWYNSAMLYARRKSSSLVSYLESSSYMISELLSIYKQTFSTVYKVDDSLLKWWYDIIPPENNIVKYYQVRENYLLEHNGVMYVLKRNEDSHIIRSIENYGSEIILSYEYTAYEDNSGHSCKLCCGNTSCPHYKSSNSREYKNGGKDVFCSFEDLRKCNQLKKAGLAHPFDVEFLFEAIAYCMINRTNGVVSEKRDDYEHLPKPERVDDVVVYFGAKKEKPILPFIKVDDIAVEKSPFPNSHASPREHIRRDGERRAYERKDGTKVRATTVKSTVVNRGHTKTTYKLKERSNA